jgi:hypothetical protein
MAERRNFQKMHALRLESNTKNAIYWIDFDNTIGDDFLTKCHIVLLIGFQNEDLLLAGAGQCKMSGCGWKKQPWTKPDGSGMGEKIAISHALEEISCQLVHSSPLDYGVMFSLHGRSPCQREDEVCWPE